jgi:dihydroorotase
VPVDQALALLTQGPARILKRDAGVLREGAQADLCLYAPEEPWLITADTLRSQGRNTPFIGRELEGRVKATLVDGRLVFRQGLDVLQK